EGIAPEIKISGNSTEILSGDDTPSSTDYTDFGDALVTSGTVSKSFTIENTGNSTLTLSGSSPYVSISGTNSSDFSVTYTPSNSIAIGSSTKFKIEFNPSDSGTRTATISIANDDSDENPYTFDIEGEGVEPEIKISGNNTEIVDGDDTPSSTDHTDFGNVLASSGTVSRTYTIENTGTSTLTLNGTSTSYIKITGTNSSDFTVTSQPSSATISANSSLTFVIEFDPSATGTRTATISASSDDSDEGFYNFDVEGEGIEPEIKISGNSTEIADGDAIPSTTDDTDFGSAVKTTGSVSKTYTIENTGGATLNLSGSSPYVSISGSNKSNFSVTSAPNNSIAAGSSTTFTVTFVPSAKGTREATLAISSDDADEGTYTFDIEGFGTSPEIRLRGNDIKISDGHTTPSVDDHTDFEETGIASGTISRTFTIDNLGTGDLVLGGSPIVALSGTNAADFEVITQPSTTTIAESDTAFFIIEFDPSAIGSSTATVTIESNDLNEATYTFTIEGTGINPEVKLSGNSNEIADGDATPSIKDHSYFGSVDESSATKTRTFTIENTGVGALNLTGTPLVSISGTNASDFSVTTQPSASEIAEDGSLTFVVEFNPSAVGVREAEVSFDCDDGDESTYNFSIAGLGSNKANYPFDWTWTGGSDTKNQSGTYGTKGTASSSNIPSARKGSMLWKAANGTVYLFGGKGKDGSGSSGLLNDLWKWDGSNWTWLAGSDDADQTGTYTGSTKTPGGRFGASGYIDASGNLWLFGGLGYYDTATEGYLNDLWKWDGSNWSWEGGNNAINTKANYGTQGQASASSWPRSASESNYWLDNDGNFWLFGGRGTDDNNNTGDLNDLWVWNGSQWAYMDGDKTRSSRGDFNSIGNATSSTEPSARRKGTQWVDENGDLYLFGGRGKDGNGATSWLSDLWKYDISAGRWTWMAGSKTGNEEGVYGTQGNTASGVYPGGRQKAVAWVDPSGNLVLYGGQGLDVNGDQGDLSDMWVWNGSQWAWTSGSDTRNDAGNYGSINATSSDNYPSGRADAMGWIDANGTIWFFGGDGIDASGNTGYLNDLWSMDMSFIWEGTSSTWSTNGNWKHGGVAKSGYPVKIPSGLSSYPTLSSDVALTDVEIENGASLTIGAGNTLSITGEFKYEGSTALALGDGKLKFNGTSAQTIDGKIDGNVEIDNSNDVSLGSDATIGTLTLTNGDLDIGDNDLTLENSSVGSSSAYIKLSGTGKVKATVGSSPVTLPIGRNPYLPIIIDDGGGAEYTVGLSENVYENPETNSTQQTTDVVGETWTIQASTSQNNVSVTLQWEAAEEETGFNRTTSNMAYWESGTSSTWDAGSSGTASGSGPYSLSRTVNFSTNLFYFGVGSAGSALPVEFTYFTSSWLE
ncbi:MAG: choice-of-anchor D domain-containing protein, partial [Bacteroidia bacterium]